MPSPRIPASAALPPALTARERAALEKRFGKAAQAARTAENRLGLVTASAAVVLAIGLLFGIHGPAHADRITVGGSVAGWLDAAR